MSRKYFTVLMILVLPVLLQSCSIYSSGFSCPEARGARCAMLSRVDNMIDSGEIETVYKDKKCRTGKCGDAMDYPSIAQHRHHESGLREPYK